MQQRARLLIVDDTPENIRILMSLLRSLCDVVAATNGTKALELARNQPQPDLILLDVMMPGLSGYDVCAELKRDPLTRNIPVIFVTGLSEVGEEEKGLRLGAVDYISKPFHPDLVKARVLNHLELKRHRDDLEAEVERRTQALLEAQSMRQRSEAEMGVARRLQLSMLAPPVFTDRRGLGCQLATALRPARAVGGDLYDYFLLDPSTLLFILGDVSDKGMAAALFMVRVTTLLRTLGPATQTPGQLLQAMNQSLCADNSECMFVTLICGLLHLETGQITLASGGHEHPIITEGPAQAQPWEFSGGPALGLCPEAEFENHSLYLKSGQTLLLYTDGIPDACNPTGQSFGEEKLLQIVTNFWNQPAHRIVEELLDSMEKFVDGAEPFDDVTLMVLKLT